MKVTLKLTLDIEVLVPGVDDPDQAVDKVLDDWGIDLIDDNAVEVRFDSLDIWHVRPGIEGFITVATPDDEEDEEEEEQ